MPDLFNQVCFGGSKLITRAYSTSFSLGIRSLHKRFHDPIYGIYGFVRFADEIVDTFHDQDQQTLFEEFEADTWTAIERRFSMNPVLHAFAQVVHAYEIEYDLITAFLKSMEMDLYETAYQRGSYDEYIYGSAEVVGLMCLRVFCEGDREAFDRLIAPAKSLGAAFQKVNFLRDMKSDYEERGRVYFPGVDFKEFTPEAKHLIEQEIEEDFAAAYEGIIGLPAGSKFGVYLAYVYYKKLFAKIRSTPAMVIKDRRIRVSNSRKALLFARSYVNNAVGII